MMTAARAGDPALHPVDRLDWRWIAALYALPWIPFGALVVVVGSSIAYYLLRKTRPVSATRLNRHAFVAFGLAVAFVVARRVLNF
jgi:hypothetical protein